jgi:hypothetical protein
MSRLEKGDRRDPGIESNPPLPFWGQPGDFVTGELHWSKLPEENETGNVA